MKATMRVPGAEAAQELDAKITESALPLGRLGVENFWTPAPHGVCKA